MNLYALVALVMLVLVTVSFGIRVIRGLRTNTTPTYYKFLLVLIFIALVASTVWQLFIYHIL